MISILVNLSPICFFWNIITTLKLLQVYIGSIYSTQRYKAK